MPDIITNTIGTGGDHTTFDSWEAATDNDLVTDDELHVGELLELLTLPANRILSGATTDATRYRELTYASGGRYDPIADSGNGLTRAATGNMLALGEDFTRLTGILLANTYNGNAIALRVDTSSSDCLIDGCTIKIIGDSTSSGYGIEMGFNGATVATIRNCVILSDGVGTDIDGLRGGATDGLYQNISIYNIQARGVHCDWITYTTRNQFINVIVMASGTADFGRAGCPASDFTYCISDDTTASTFANSFDSETVADIYNDAGSDDLRPAGGNETDNGSDLSGSFTTDLDGATRSGDWEMGAYTEISSGISPMAFLQRFLHQPVPNPLQRM